MRSLLIISFILALPVSVWSQDINKRALERDAENFLRVEDYVRAYETLTKLDSAHPDNPDYQYLLGKCCLHYSRCKSQSIDYFKTVLQEDPENKEAQYYLGRAYHLNVLYQEAIQAYKKYLDSMDVDMDKEKKALVERQIQMCKNGRKLTKTQYDFKIQNIGGVINTEYPEYAPVISADESMILFTSRRPGSTGGRQNVHGHQDPKGRYFEDIYVAKRKEGESWSDPVSIGTAINTEGHDATIGLSADGQKLFIYKSDAKRWGNIYVSELKGAEWTEPKKVGDNINSKFWEGSASISGDENVLYFSSNRKGGEGKRDIYRSRKLPNGQWAKPENLGDVVNTPYQEDAPFIHPDGKTLFFSSKGHNSMGGYDIFKSVYEDGEWSEPQNLSMPVNTPDDDIYFVLSADGETGYISADRQGGFGSQDLFTVDMPEDFGEQPVVTLMKGFITENEEAVKSKILVTDNESKELQGVYNSNASTGKYLIVVPAGKNYNITFETEGYIFYSQNIHYPDQDSFVIIRKDIELFSESDNRSVILKEVVFKKSSDEFHRGAGKQLDKIYQVLDENPSLKLDIGAYVDSTQGVSESKLAQSRADRIKKYFTDKGIDEKRLRSAGYHSSSDSTYKQIMAARKATNRDVEPSPDYIKINITESLEAPQVAQQTSDTVKTTPTAEKTGQHRLFGQVRGAASIYPVQVELTNKSNSKLVGRQTVNNATTTYSFNDLDAEQGYNISVTNKDKVAINQEVGANNWGDSKDYRYDIQIIETKQVETKTVTTRAPGDREAIRTETLYFGFDGANLDAKSRQKLKNIVQTLRSDENTTVTLIGHTDTVGNTKYNLNLSFRRAYGVAEHLLSKGIQQDQIETTGRGEGVPITDEKGRYSASKSRRVEIKLYND